jgi:hypothetical protein
MASENEGAAEGTIMNSWKARRPPAWELPRLVSKRPTSLGGRDLNSPAVQDVHEGNREDIGLLGAGKVRDVGVERHGLLGSAGLGNGQAHTKDGVGTKLGLVGGAIEVDQELVNLGLVLDIDVLLDDGGADDLVDILDGLEDALAAPLGLVAVAELASLVLACIASMLACVFLFISLVDPGMTNRWKRPRGQWRGGGQAQSRHRPRRWGYRESRRRSERGSWRWSFC